MTYKTMLLSSALLVSMSGVAAAQGTGAGDDQDEQQGYMFDTVDANADGMVDEAELQAAFDEVGDSGNASDIIAQRDTDGDGMISRDEAAPDGQVYALPDDEDDV